MMRRMKVCCIIAVALSCILFGCNSERKKSEVFVTAQREACTELATWMNAVEETGLLQIPVFSVSEGMEIFLAIVDEENVTVSQEEIALDGEKLMCRVYTCRPTKLQIQEVLTKVSEQIKENPLPEWMDLFLQEEVVTALLADVEMTASKMEAQNVQWMIYVVKDRIHKQRIEWNQDNALEYETIGSWSNGRYDAFRRVQNGEEVRLMISKIATEGLSYNGEWILWKKGQEKKHVMRFSFEGKERSVLGMPEGVMEATIDAITVRMEVSKCGEDGFEHNVTMAQPDGSHQMCLITGEKTTSSNDSNTVEVNGKGYSMEYVKSQIRQILWGLIEKSL